MRHPILAFYTGVEKFGAWLGLSPVHAWRWVSCFMLLIALDIFAASVFSLGQIYGWQGEVLVLGVGMPLLFWSQVMLHRTMPFGSMPYDG